MFPRSKETLPSKNSFINRPEVPTSSYLVNRLSETIIVPARRTRVVPGECAHHKSKKPASSTPRMYNTW